MSGNRNRPGVQGRTDEPGNVFAGFGISNVYTIVRLTEAPSDPGKVDEAEVLIHEGDHGEQCPLPPIDFHQVELEAGMDQRTKYCRVDQTGDDGEVRERGFNINTTSRLACEEFVVEGEIVHRDYQKTK